MSIPNTRFGLLLLTLCVTGCMTSPPLPQQTAYHWRCQVNDAPLPVGHVVLPPLPLIAVLSSAAEQPVSLDSPYGSADNDIAQYQQAWLSLLDVLQQPGQLDQLTAMPPQQRLTAINTVLRPDFFTQTEKHLVNALAKSPALSPEQRRSLEITTLHHQHMRLLFTAARSRDDMHKGEDAARLALTNARRLQQFRLHFADTLRQNVAILRTAETAAGDWAGEQWAQLFQDAEARRTLPGIWLLQTDDSQIGLLNGWQQRSLADWRQSKPQLLQMEQPWPQNTRNRPFWLIQSIQSTDLQKNATAYLNFYALPGRCTLYFNGRPAGQKDGAAPQSIRVELSEPNLELPEQSVVLYFPDGCPGPYPYPVWLSQTPAKKD